MNKSGKRNKNDIPTDLSTDLTDSRSNANKAKSANSPDKTLKLMYSMACFANLIINLDHGIIPACTQELMRDLNMNEFKLGTLGSVVYVGLLLGSISSGPLLQNYSSKKIIAGSTLGNILSLLIFPLTTNFFLLCVSRCLVGFFQVFLVIYFPVWVDLHGKERKTMWITFLQVGVAFGVVLGYVLTALSVKFLTWKVSFYSQTILLIPCFIAFALFEEKLMATNSKNVRAEDVASEEDEGHERYLLTISHSGSFYGHEVRDYILGNEPKDTGKKGVEVGGDDDENIGDKLTYVDYIKILWTKKVYLYTMLAISSLYFVITGIQFWISDYMRTVLRQEKGTVFVAFASISTIGPIMGVAVGGKLMDRLGGYTSAQALDFCLFCGLMASLAAMPVPFLNSFAAICTLLFVLLFFGGALMPAVIGIMLSSIPKKMKAIGYSTAYIVQNFLGYVPAPLAYGTVINMTGGEESRFGMVLLMTWSTFGVFALFAAKNARMQKHMDYMKMQYIELGDEELHKPDLFEPKPKNIELRGLKDAIIDEDSFDSEVPKRVRHARTRTFVPPDVLIRRKSTVAFKPGKMESKPGKVEKELEALGHAVVDYQMLRQSRGGNILSKENLKDLPLMFGKGGMDRPKRTKDEML